MKFFLLAAFRGSNLSANETVSVTVSSDQSLVTVSPVEILPSVTTLALSPRRRRALPRSEFTNRWASRPKRWVKACATSLFRPAPQIHEPGGGAAQGRA